MKTIICEKNDAVRQAAEIVSGLLKEKPDAVLALACGETMAPLWAELSRACAEGACSLKDARILCATELCGVSEEKSCRHALTKGLIETTDARKENCFLSARACRDLVNSSAVLSVKALSDGAAIRNASAASICAASAGCVPFGADITVKDRIVSYYNDIEQISDS